MNPPIRQQNEVPVFDKTTILIVEDNYDHLSLIISALKQCMPGVNAVGVANKGAAMTYIATSWQERSAVPRLVLLDLYLPTPAEGLSAMTDFKDYFRSNDQPPYR